MTKFNKGDKVEQIMPLPIKGSIDAFSIDQNTGDPQLHVTWQDEKQISHGHWFKDHEVRLQGETK